MICGGRVRRDGGRRLAARAFGALGLRLAVSAGAVAVLLALVAWFGAELITSGRAGRPGGTIFGAAQALSPREAADPGTRRCCLRVSAGPAGKEEFIIQMGSW